jgi:cytidylate kinase
MIITIDGPAGSGKSTIAKKLADYLGFLYLDTGATYRAVAYAVKEKLNINSLKEKEILQILESLDIKISFEKGEFHIFLNNEDITEKIKTEEIGQWASRIASFPSVKEKLFELQRKLVDKKDAVVEGRDAGLYVFPNADIKIFLTATSEERAKRRYLQLKEKGISVEYDEILQSILERDKRDQNRQKYPFKPAEDAIIIDTTGKTLEEVFKEVLNIVKRKS